MHSATILHAGALGDLILTLHLARRIDAIVRCDRVRLISRIDPGRAAVARWPGLERMSIEGIGSHWLYGELADDPPPRLRDLVCDATVFSALGGPQSMVATRLNMLSPRRAMHLDPRPIDGSVRHITEQWRDCLATQGAAIKACVYSRRAGGLGAALREIEPASNPKANPGAPGQRPKSTPDATRTVLIHPGSGGVSKCWSVAGFVAVASELARRGVTVRFAIGPAERERWSCETIARFADVAAVETLESIDDFADALAGADAYLGNDSGPTHLAAWLGKPTLALFGPTDARIWRPLGNRVTSLRGDPTVDAATWGIQPARVVAALFGDGVA